VLFFHPGAQRNISIGGAVLPTKPAMYALLDLHSTFGGDILKNKERAAELASAMRHVEAVI
jgi:hypothetical protein